uniref:Uncharacterized protein n=1 Tax=Oryza sativa subsp. japonica TaxID=39947 RepID=Q6EQ55_ORYSJ|nr:hypothetical protein [Oryza sativa Japonica Group]BAD29215.1 hypothetical protein [Oryza sativa Japonica Group]
MAAGGYGERARLKYREAPKDYEEVLGGGGPRWHGDELPRRRSYEPDGARNREETHRGDGSVWVRRRHSVWPAGGATVALPFPANQRVSVFGFGCGGGGRRGTQLVAGAGFAQGYQRGCRVSQREPGAVGLALSLWASALAGGGGIGLATAAAVVGAWARQGSGRDGVGFV